MLNLCNRSLQKLGLPPITDLGGKSKSAHEFKQAFSGVYPSLLRKARWHFAIKRKLLQELDEPLVEDKYHTYINPHDCICIIDNPHDWVFEGKKILSSETPPLKIRYIARLNDLEDCDPLFLEALATNIALELCETLLGSESRKQTLRREFEMLMDKAKTTGVIEMSPPRFIKKNKNLGNYS